MRAARWIQLIWTGLAALMINPMTVNTEYERGPYYSIAYVWVYFVVAVCCFLRDWPYCWWLALTFPIVPIIYMSEFAIGNAYLIATWQEPYQKEPSMVVATLVVFCVTIAPALAIYWFLYRDRRRLVSVLKGGDSDATSDTT